MASNVFTVAYFALTFFASIIILPIGKSVPVQAPDRQRISEGFVENEKVARVKALQSNNSIWIDGISPGITRIDIKSVKNVERHIWVVVPKP